MFWALKCLHQASSLIPPCVQLSIPPMIWGKAQIPFHLYKETQVGTYSKLSTSLHSNGGIAEDWLSVSTAFGYFHERNHSPWLPRVQRWCFSEVWIGTPLGSSIMTGLCGSIPGFFLSSSCLQLVIQFLLPFELLKAQLAQGELPPASELCFLDQQHLPCPFTLSAANK